MAHHASHTPYLTQEQKNELKKKLEISNFDINAIVRGAQLTVVGALRALQNPALFTSEHYKQVALAVAAGIIIRVAITVPIIGIRVLLWFLSFFINLDGVTWDDTLINGLDFIQNYVLQLPFFLMMCMRHITPTLDNMFMDSLAWVDKTYQLKHKDEDPTTLREMYYPNMRLYSTRHGSTHSKNTKSPVEALKVMLIRLGKKAGISITIYALSYVPYLGRLVLPAASFYTFNKAVGLGPSAIIFGTGILLPRRYLIIFLQSYFTSRSLMRELLEPYFSRIQFTKEQKKRWFHDREGLLFGFGVGFYIFLRIPLLGVLIYGIAEASTAYLITKITDPPPNPDHSEGFAASQQTWKNKHEILSSKLFELDAPDAPDSPDASNGSDEDKNLMNVGTTNGGSTSSVLPSGPPPAYEELRSR